MPLRWSVETGIFVAMVLIFAAGFWRVRRRSLEIRRRMAEEENSRQNPSEDSASGTS